MTKSLHQDHRKRLKSRFRAEGLDNFDSHNVVELLLFFGVPQGDTNPLAHRLIEQFGSLSQVLEAPYEQLLEVDGIGEHCATLITLVPRIAKKYLLSDRENVYLENSEKVGRFMLPYFFAEKEEQVYLLCLDSKMKLIRCEHIQSGSYNVTEVSVKKIAQAVLRNRASRVILVHNHPGGVALPSPEDITTTTLVKQALKTLDIELCDHVIVADREWVSFADTFLEWSK